MTDKHEHEKDVLKYVKDPFWGSIPKSEKCSEQEYKNRVLADNDILKDLKWKKVE